MKALRFRRPGTCAQCGIELSVGTAGWWDAATKSTFCVACGDARSVPDPSAQVDFGAAGASAAREHERRASRERRRQERAVEQDAQWRREVVDRRPVVGRIQAALRQRPEVTGPSSATKAWAVGAEGEERVAEVLSSCEGVVALHDRRIPGSKANIDHLAVTSRGVFVIDAKKYTGEIAVRDVGPLWRSEPRLYVNGRNQTKLVEGVRRQVAVVEGAVAASGPGVPVFGVLCFVGAGWPLLFRRPLVVDGVTSVWPLGLADVLAGSPDAGIDAAVVARALADLLPPA